jgi:hypothetical protein
MPWFEIDGKSIYDFLRDPAFHLIVFKNGAGESLQPGPEWNGTIDVHHFELTETVRTRFGTDDPFFVILRPDNYIGLISDDFSPEIVSKYLARFI